MKVILAEEEYRELKDVAMKGKYASENLERGHFIFISEYKAPDDFRCVWEKQITNSMHSPSDVQAG